jgi:hypothetical protein
MSHRPNATEVADTRRGTEVSLPVRRRGVARLRGGLLAATLSAVVALLAGLFVAAGPSSASHPPEPPGGCARHMGWCIAQLASYEFTNRDGHKYERPLGSNCNYFTTKAWHAPGAKRCSNGWWSEEWCMDFSRWVYNQERASVTYLNHLAASAYTYGTKHHTWRHTPRAGDLALWKGRGHVGIVVTVKPGKVQVVSGNSWNPSRRDYTAIWKAWYPVKTFEGFAGPA